MRTHIICKYTKYTKIYFETVNNLQECVKYLLYLNIIYLVYIFEQISVLNYLKKFKIYIFIELTIFAFSQHIGVCVVSRNNVLAGRASNL